MKADQNLLVELRDNAYEIQNLKMKENALAKPIAGWIPSKCEKMEEALGF